MTRKKIEAKKKNRVKIMGAVLVLIMAASLLAIVMNNNSDEEVGGPVAQPLMYGFEQPIFENIDFHIDTLTPIVIVCEKIGNESCKNLTVANSQFFDASVLVIYDDDVFINGQVFESNKVYDYIKENNSFKIMGRDVNNG